MTTDEAAIRRNKGRAMSKGEIGCYASHFSIWRDMIERGVRQAIVLEDDTVVDWAYLEPLARTDLHAEGIDYRSEEHTSELQSLMRTSYAVFCFKKKNTLKHKHLNK